MTPTGNVAPLPRPPVWNDVTPGQLSVATGVVYDTTAPHVPAVLFTVMFAGHAIVGFSLSLTVTVKLQLAVFPAPSVTRNVFVVVPAGNVAPLARPAVCVVVAPGQLSVPDGVVYATTAPHVPAALFIVMFAGHVIVGSSVSARTLIVTSQLSGVWTPSKTVSVAVQEKSRPSGRIRNTLSLYCPPTYTFPAPSTATPRPPSSGLPVPSPAASMISVIVPPGVTLNALSLPCAAR